MAMNNSLLPKIMLQQENSNEDEKVVDAEYEEVNDEKDKDSK